MLVRDVLVSSILHKQLLDSRIEPSPESSAVIDVIEGDPCTCSHLIFVRLGTGSAAHMMNDVHKTARSCTEFPVTNREFP